MGLVGMDMARHQATDAPILIHLRVLHPMAVHQVMAVEAVDLRGALTVQVLQEVLMVVARRMDLLHLQMTITQEQLSKVVTAIQLLIQKTRKLSLHNR